MPPRQGARALPSNPRNIRRRLPSETPQPRHGEHPRRGTLEGLRAGGALQGRVARLVGQDQPLPARLVLAAGPFLRRERACHPRHHPKVRLGEELARRRGTGVREASLPSRSHHGDCRQTTLHQSLNRTSTLLCRQILVVCWAGFMVPLSFVQRPAGSRVDSWSTFPVDYTH